MNAQPISSCALPCLQQIKTVEKVALTGLFISSLVFMILAATIKLPVPPIAFYSLGGGGVVLSLILTAVITYIRSEKIPGQKKGVELAKLSSPEPTPKSSPVVKQKSPENIKEKAFQLIESLGQPDLEDRLKDDFELVLEQELDADKAYLRMLAMFEALPYYLSLDKQAPVSPYPPVGIRNYHGNNCHFNAGMQVLVHTRLADYALLRPERPPLPPIPLAEVEKPPEKVEPPDWDLYAFATQEERLEVSRKYDEEKDALKKKQEIYKDYERDLEKHGWALKRYDRALKNYHQNCKLKPELFRVICSMRKGVTVSKIEVENIFSLLNYDLGKQGDVSGLLYTVHSCSPLYHKIIVNGCDLEEIQNGALRRSSMPIIVLGSGDHYKVYLRSKTGNSCINDGSVSKCSSDWNEVIKDIETNRTKWQPYIVETTQPKYLHRF